eukprot:5350931-Amphidinium_carterae.1
MHLCYGRRWGLHRVFGQWRGIGDGKQLHQLMRRILYIDQQRKCRQLFTMKQERGVYNILVKADHADVGTQKVHETAVAVSAGPLISVAAAPAA